jgi:hypothetical protein
MPLCRTELSLRTRLVLLFASLAAVVALAPAVYLPRALEEQSRRWAERRCLDVARAIAGAAEAPLDFDDRSAAAEVLAGLEAAKGAAYAALLRPDGTRLAAWREPPANAPLPSSENGGLAYGSGILQVRVDVAVPSGSTGALVVGFTLDELAERRRDAQELVVRTSLIVLLAAIAAAFASGTLLLRPLRRVIAVAARIARGDEAAALDLVGQAFGEEAEVVAVPVERLSPDFFRLATGVAGAIVQKFVNYRLRLVVVGDVAHHGEPAGPVADWIREADRGRELWFVADEVEEPAADFRAFSQMDVLIAVRRLQAPAAGPSARSGF